MVSKFRADKNIKNKYALHFYMPMPVELSEYLFIIVFLSKI